MVARAMILGLTGHELTHEERGFFRDTDPWGFILFRRNIDTPSQVERLTAELRSLVGRDAPILVDQEGGRVQRLAPPHWPAYPPARRFLAAADTIEDAEALCRTGARLIARDLRAVGIDVDCLPVLDVPAPGAHAVIGDRAYAEDAGLVSRLGRAAAEGLLDEGVLPVVKHIPGHGRAGVDSHHALPVVDAAAELLDRVDFAPFRALADMPLGMTAHVVFTAFDDRRCATHSPTLVHEIIRRRIGFDGLLMSDDVGMKALGGSFGERTRNLFAAGCDIALHCSGDIGEMREVAANTPLLAGEPLRRAERALAMRKPREDGFDPVDSRARLAALLAS